MGQLRKLKAKNSKFDFDSYYSVSSDIVLSVTFKL